MDNSASIKKMLLKTYKFRVELHAHTYPVSGCSEVSPEELIGIYHEKGYDAIAVTNHFALEGLEKEAMLDRYMADYEAAKIAGEKCGMKVFLGAELRFTENSNDYLIYGADRDVLAVCHDYLSRGIKAFRDEVFLPKSVFIQAHPFRDRMELCDPKLLDGMETFNMHPKHNARIGIAARYAEENGIEIRIAGSDFHHPNAGHEAVAAMRCKNLPENSFELAEILKKGDYIFEIGESSLLLP